jgi:ATP-binding cassette, subfamily B, bacterial
MRIPINPYPYGQLLARYLKPQSPKVALLAVLLFGGIGLQLANPQVIRYFLDTTQSGGAQSALLFAAGLFIAFALAQQAASVAATYVGQDVGWKATNALRKDLALHCLRLDMSFHKTRTPGELIERVDGDVTALANFFSQFAIKMLGNAGLVIGILILLWREDVRVGVGLTLYTGATLFLLSALQRLAVSRWAAARQSAAEQYGFIEERISGVEDIRANGAMPYVMRRLYQLMRDRLEKGRAAFLMSSLTFNVTNLLSVAGYAIGLALGVYLYGEGRATIGAAYLIVAYVGMLSTPLQNIREQVQDLQQAAASLQRVEELFRLQPGVGSGWQVAGDKALSRVTPHASLPNGALSVEFQNVSFSYNDNGEDGNVLHEVSFHLRPGKVLGVLGRTGSGKTTLTRLLFRLHEADEGVIRLGGVDIREAPLSNLRARVGIVTQDVQLFQATLRDNLAFFNPRIRDEQIERALKELRLWDWLRSLPDGLDTKLAAGGQGLSAGEAQLLAFTRVFLKDPGLVILDEASSRLDPATENLLERAVDRLFDAPRRTGLVIAHRLQTVQRADDLLILEQGRVVEVGPRTQLAADPDSRFSSLLKIGLDAAQALA